MTTPRTPVVLWTLESADTVLQFDDYAQELTGMTISHGNLISKKPRYGGAPLVRVVSRLAATATIRGRVWHMRKGWTTGRQLADWSAFSAYARWQLTDADGRDYGEWFIEKVDLQSSQSHDAAFLKSVFTIRMVEVTD